MACVLCGSADRPTDEDVIPKWLLRAFDVQGPVTVNVRKESGKPQLVARRRSPKVIYCKAVSAASAITSGSAAWRAP